MTLFTSYSKRHHVFFSRSFILVYDYNAMPSAVPMTDTAMTDNAQVARSPSPPPAPPLARAPGPRATALQKVFNDALSHTLRACSYNNFAECFPTPAKYVPQALDGLHRDFVGKLEEMCKVSRTTVTPSQELIRLAMIGRISSTNGRT